MTPAALTVAVFSSTRADLWPLAPVIRRLDEDSRFTTFVVSTSNHLTMATAGSALDGIDVETIDVGDDSDRLSIAELVAADARVMLGTAEVLERRRPDVLLVLGDRHELLAALAAAVLYSVPVGHLHGGELTEGSSDDAVRHAVTKLAALHFAATETAARRILSMGEEAWRVHVTGAPGLDHLHQLAAAFTADDLVAAIGGPLEPPVGLLTFHPPTLQPDLGRSDLDATLAGCDDLRTVIATFPGRDPGAPWIIERLEKWAASRAGVLLVPTLGALYAAALTTVDVVVGNSSSGIIEAPSFGVPVVNVGDRQAGRERATSIIDVVGAPDAVREAVRRALDVDFRAAAGAAVNPYGDGTAAVRIADILATAPLDRLLRKRFAACDRS